tara:strand:- start:610 stop:1638 length:1029 start_codon:yes stop_codon:yes gene_type:complete
MAIDQTKKSNRLLGSRRFTSDALNTSQEAFQSVLDLRANEIYTEANLIPTSGLPFSGSSQQQSTFTTQGSDVLKYYFRQRLTRSNVANDVFFFMVPTGSSTGVTPQLIQDDQQTNFISPKYSLSSLANANAEDSTPGYNVKVFKSTSLNSGSLGGDDVVSANDYQFDYKTGVLQFESALASNLEVYMTAYQYVGKTLDQGANFSGDIVINNVSSSLIPAADDKHDIGSTTREWKDLFIDGTANIDTLSLTDAFTYNGVTFNTSGSASPATSLQITGSQFDLRATNSENLFTLRNSSGDISLQLDDRVVVLGSLDTTPTPVAGGFFYSGSDQFFLGFEGSGLP